MELLTDLKGGTTDNYIDDFLKAEELIIKFISDEYLGGKPIMPLIDNS